MEEEADGLPVHEELPGDVAGAAADEEGDAVDAPASEASCLNMNPMFKALPCMPVKAHAERTREVATADHAARVVPALLAAITAASCGKGRQVLLAMRKYNLIDTKMRRAGRPAASGAPAADDGCIILCCGPHGLWPTQLISQMRDNRAGISQCRGFVCTHKVPGHAQTWVEGLAMRKVVTELNGMLPPQASTTPGQGTGTSFVLFSAIHEPDGLCDHELVVHDCVGGVDNSAQRVLERMRNAWLSDWLLSVTKPEPVREDACLFIIADADGVGRLRAWQDTGMNQKPLASFQEILRRPVSCRARTPPAEGGCNEDSSSRSATVTSSAGSSVEAEVEGAVAGAAAGGDAAQRCSKRVAPDTPAASGEGRGV